MPHAKLTTEQLENWRNILATQIGERALTMTDEQIEDLRKKMQSEVVGRYASEDFDEEKK